MTLETQVTSTTSRKRGMKVSLQLLPCLLCFIELIFVMFVFQVDTFCKELDVKVMISVPRLLSQNKGITSEEHEDLHHTQLLLFFHTTLLVKLQSHHCSFITIFILLIVRWHFFPFNPSA